MTPYGHFARIVARQHDLEGAALVDDVASRDAWLEQRGLVAGDLTAIDDALMGPIAAAASPRDADHYAELYRTVFAALDRLDTDLTSRRFVAGATPGLADWWLFAILIRFDAVYYPLYKLNRTRLRDFATLPHYLGDLYQQGPAVGTIDWTAIRQPFLADDAINHKQLLPRGGEPDLFLGHARSALAGSDGATVATAGSWQRKESRHRRRIGDTGLPAEAGRYHLYVANNCPWCHRVALTRSLKGLEEVVSMDVLFYRRDPHRGWQFAPDEPGCTEDRLFGHRYIRELYEREGSREKSVPVLFDRVSGRIVNNESAEIIRMLDQAFASDAPSLYPADQRAQIEALNRWIYDDVNNGAYKAGFTSSQHAYEVAYVRFFAALRRLDALLADRKYLTGDQLTEADVRLFPTIFRFDPIYFTRFRLGERMVADHAHLARWQADMLSHEAVQRASNLEHCRRGYFGRTGNGIVPLGPETGPT